MAANFIGLILSVCSSADNRAAVDSEYREKTYPIGKLFTRDTRDVFSQRLTSSGFFRSFAQSKNSEPIMWSRAFIRCESERHREEGSLGASGGVLRGAPEESFRSASPETLCPFRNMGCLAGPKHAGGNRRVRPHCGTNSPGLRRPISQRLAPAFNAGSSRLEVACSSRAD